MARNGERVTVRSVERAPEGAPVRHVDELSERDLAALVRLADGGAGRVPGVDPGEVVVFTSYLEVVRADAERARGRERDDPAGRTGRTEARDARADAGPVG